MKVRQINVFAIGMLVSTWVLANAGTKVGSLSTNNDNFLTNLQTVTKTNFKNIANLGIPSAQSSFPGYSSNKINDGVLTTTVGPSYSWTNGHFYTANGRLPQWVQLSYAEKRMFAKVVIYTSSGYEMKDYDIQVRNGKNWITVVEQRGNTNVKRIHTFTPVSGTVLRILALRGPDRQKVYARLNEVEVFEVAENLALSAIVTAQSSFSGYSPTRVNDGSTNTKVGPSYSWSNEHKYTKDGHLSQWLQLDFGKSKTLSKVVLYTSLGYEIKDYDIQVWTDNRWVKVVQQRGNTSVSRAHTFAPIIGSKLRVIGHRGPDNQNEYVRINELEVY
ncbi:discoidin domain-containing protein [Marinomonas agarivorans]|nr:discoidin domain-containing protein [Marinomonas agarivorans]